MTPEQRDKRSDEIHAKAKAVKDAKWKTDPKAHPVTGPHWIDPKTGNGLTLDQAYKVVHSGSNGAVSVKKETKTKDKDK